MAASRLRRVDFALPMPTAEAIHQLRESVAELEALERRDLPLTHFVVDVGPVRTGEKSFIAGYPDYQPAMDRLWTAIGEAGLFDVTPEAYGEWLAGHWPPLESAADIARLEREELLLRLFTIRRAERFCDGYWTSLLERGLLLAYARRLLQLIAP